jgi:hypothetical protein
MMRRLPAIAVVVLALCGLSAVAAYDRPAAPAWQDIAWPFPRDGWPAGRAFRCAGEGCRGVELYVRPKSGFCNCDTGVADDDEVDRVADLDLISPRFAPREPGAPIRVAGLAGRIRAYDMQMPDGVRHAVIGIAVAQRCDLLVAVAQGEGSAEAIQQAALALLESNEIRSWVQAAMQAR